MNTQALGVAVEACGLCGGSGRVPLDWDGPMPSDLVALAGLVTCPDCRGTGELPAERMNIMTNTQTVEQAALGELRAAIGRIEALTPLEAAQARERLLAHSRESRAEGAPLTVEELALADLDRMLSERAAQG